MGSLYLGGRTIQEVDGEMMMGLSIYGVAVMDGSLYSRFYGIWLSSARQWTRTRERQNQPQVPFQTQNVKAPLHHCDVLNLQDRPI